MLKHNMATTSATKHHIICIYLILSAQILCMISRYGGRNLHKFPIHGNFVYLVGTAVNVPFHQVTRPWFIRQGMIK